MGHRLIITNWIEIINRRPKKTNVMIQFCLSGQLIALDVETKPNACNKFFVSLLWISSRLSQLLSIWLKEEQPNYIHTVFWDEFTISSVEYGHWQQEMFFELEKAQYFFIFFGWYAVGFVWCKTGISVQISLLIIIIENQVLQMPHTIIYLLVNKEWARWNKSKWHFVYFTIFLSLFLCRNIKKTNSHSVCWWCTYTLSTNLSNAVYLAMAIDILCLIVIESGCNVYIDSVLKWRNHEKKN